MTDKELEKLAKERIRKRKFNELKNTCKMMLFFIFLTIIFLLVLIPVGLHNYAISKGHPMGENAILITGLFTIPFLLIMFLGLVLAISSMIVAIIQKRKDKKLTLELTKEMIKRELEESKDE